MLIIMLISELVIKTSNIKLLLSCPPKPGILARSDRIEAEVVVEIRASREAEARAEVVTKVEVVAGAKAEVALRIEAKAEIGLAIGVQAEAGTLLLNPSIGWLIANVTLAMNQVTLWLLALKETHPVPEAGARIGAQEGDLVITRKGMGIVRRNLPILWPVF